MIRKRFILAGLLLLLSVIISIVLIVFAHKAVDMRQIGKSAHTNTTRNVTNHQINHVFVILEENHNWPEIFQNPDAVFIKRNLIKTGAYASNYRNVPESFGSLHPSEPNYIFLEAGKNSFGDTTISTDDDPSSSNSTSSKDHFVSLLEKNGYTWKSYQEDISGNDCPINSNGNYAPKHNPFLYFQDVSGNPPSSTNSYCIQHIRPINELENDIKNNTLPNYVFITPNLQNDMHDGSIAQADTWLSQIVPQITNSSEFKKDGALFITWDEGSETKNKEKNQNQPIGMIILSPFIKKGYTNNIAYSHASFLKTVEEIFHIKPLLGISADSQTNDLFDFFKISK